ncbi:hypothetical protein [Nocardiopsis sp. JB363]|uniref:hypothetical protein n=1 Tax=Nocardiopsis sp. JB363 TaxID=1434837 RepID=UPI00097B88C6|nr:hypothetical protein [Nocardiopsis sp. JB363]SIO89581.1 hypothetical protein BQ8420_22315 [Nocardiopsis sp. JB363]
MDIHRSLAQRLADQHITTDLLQQLASTGPGALIIANRKAGEYRLTHHRYLRPTQGETVVYAYGDLTHDWDTALLISPHDPWDHITQAANTLAHTCLEWQPWEPITSTRRHFQGQLRQAMFEQGFLLLRRPMFTDRGGMHRLDDTYLDTTRPEITITIAVPYPEPDRGSPIITWCTRRGVFQGCTRSNSGQGARPFAQDVRTNITRVFDQR